MLLSHLSGEGGYVVVPQAAATYPSPMPRRMLDFFFLPAACRDVRCKVLPTRLSDHRPVLVELTF
jgi:endonuclease/exonuclease/phosphatase family metal-dependent hydrolase